MLVFSVALFTKDRIKLLMISKAPQLYCTSNKHKSQQKLQAT
jgi:hypothetical protein